MQKETVRSSKLTKFWKFINLVPGYIIINILMNHNHHYKTPNHILKSAVPPPASILCPYQPSRCRYMATQCISVHHQHMMCRVSVAESAAFLFLNTEDYRNIC